MFLAFTIVQDFINRFGIQKIISGDAKVKNLFLGFLILAAMLPIAFMTGCGSNTPTSTVSPANATATAIAKEQLTATFTPTATGTPIVPVTLNLGAAGSAGAAGRFAILSGSAITNAAETVCGNIGLYFPSGTANSSTGYTSPSGTPVITCSGAVYTQDSPANNAQNAMAAIFGTGAGGSGGAYNTALALSNPTSIPNELGGQVLQPGLYVAAIGGSTPGTFDLGTPPGSSNTLTLSTTVGNPNGIYIFMTGTSGAVGTSLITAAGSSIVLNNVLAKNVFWIVGTAATFGASTTFAGTVMTGTAITFGTSVALEGNAFAFGAVNFTGLTSNLFYP